jgi:hypothetical protein
LEDFGFECSNAAHAPVAEDHSLDAIELLGTDGLAGLVELAGEIFQGLCVFAG